MGKKHKIIGYLYCGLILCICMYVIVKTDFIQTSVVQDLKQLLSPGLMNKNEKDSMVNELAPLLGMDEEMLEDGTNDLSYDDFSTYQIFEEEATVTDGMEIAANSGEDEETMKEEMKEATAEAMVFPLPNGITYSMEQLTDYDFLVSNCYAIDESTSVLPEELDIKALLSKDLKVHIQQGQPKVLIYHTHGSEAFADSREGVIEDTVIGVGDELTRILEEDYGIPVYHDRNIYDNINGTIDRSYAYELAGNAVDDILEEYPSIEVVLDIHRDGVREDVHLVKEIDGRPTAQIMFLNGMSRLKDQGDIDYLYNPYKTDNLAFSLQMHLIGKKYYGDLMRRIYVRAYCFNLNKMPRSSLIEIGAQTNTVEEAKNAMTPLGAILYKVLVTP